MGNVFLGLFKTIFSGPSVINGLAVAYNPAYSDGRFRKVYDKNYGLINSKLLAGVGFDDTDLVTRALFRSPGKYTGEMRKVVQALYSQGKSCPYEYSFNKCHGIYTAADSSKWVIQIDGNGVKAAPLPVVIPSLAEFSWLGYTPDYNSDLFAASNPDVINLLDSSGVSDFYSKSYVFLSCGWAFNSNGHEAQNVVTGGDGVSSVTTGYRYKISISETSNQPSAAALTLEESGQFALSRYKGMKVPAADESKLEQTINQFGQGTIGTFSAPRYVFYDNDTPIVVRSQGVAGSTSETASDTIIGVAGGLTVGNVYLSNNRNDYDNTYYLSGTKTTEKEGTVVDGFAVKEDVSGTNLACLEYKRTNDDRVTHNSTFGIFWPIYKLEGWEYTVTGQERRHVSYCIVPLWEREAVYQYEWQEKAAIPKDYGWAYGNGQTSCTKTSLGDSCYQVDSIVQAGPFYSLSFSSRSFIHQNWTAPEVGDTLCEDSSQHVTPYQGSSSENTANYEAILSIVSSGGVNETIWIDNTINSDIVSYNNDPDPENPQWMHSHKDSSKINTLFCSNKMNSMSGADAFILNVNETNYPISTLNSISNPFWVGEP